MALRFKGLSEILPWGTCPVHVYCETGGGGSEPFTAFLNPKPVALIIRIGFQGILYCSYTEEPSKNPKPQTQVPGPPPQAPRV